MKKKGQQQTFDAVWQHHCSSCSKQMVIPVRSLTAVGFSFLTRRSRCRRRAAVSFPAMAQASLLQGAGDRGAATRRGFASIRGGKWRSDRSEEHTSELQSPM